MATKKDEKGTDVAVQEEVKGGVPMVADFGDDAGAGLEGMSREEQRIPFLEILQAMSPQCDPASGVKDARPGMFINLATNELYPGEEGFDMAFACRDHNFVERVPMAAGGGFVGIWDPRDPAVAKKVEALVAAQGKFGRILLENGNELVETYYLFGHASYPMFDDANVVFPLGVRFKSTQIKKYQNIISRVNTLRYKIIGFKDPQLAPIWAHRWHLSTVLEQNKKGQKYYGWRVQLAGEPAINALISRQDPLYEMGRSFNEMFKAGKIKADMERTGADSDGDEDEKIDA